MKKWIVRSVLLSIDALSIFLAIVIAFFLREWNDASFELTAPSNLSHYLQFTLIYGIILILFSIEGIYSKRYDFWQEFEQIFKAIILSGVLVFAVLAMTKSSLNYSRFIIFMIFFLLTIIIPIQKYFLKLLLFNLGYWKYKASVIGGDLFFEEHVFSDPYLGYIEAERDNAETIFISSTHSKERIEEILHEALFNKQEVIFVPEIKNFDFTKAHIIHLFNARANLIIIENNLLNVVNRGLKLALDYFLAILILPFLMLILGIIAWKIKREDGGTIFFKQTRLGQNGKEFECYKFRSMQEDAEFLLQKYLNEYPEEVSYYNTYHKYMNDPRITKMGALLRKTSLDELPQVINIIKGEMSLIGPRPYLPCEYSKLGESADMILAVKPGITGLWQVSGRSDVDFKSRTEMDVWYVRNWNVWNDIIILIKTIQVVLERKGSY